MSRSNPTMSNSTIKSKSQRIHPIWRGIGCLSILALTVGAYFAAGFAIDVLKTVPSLPLPIPDVKSSVGPIFLPWVKLEAPYADTITIAPFNVSWTQLSIAAAVDVVVYALVFIIYSLVNPNRLGPKDAPPVYPRKGRPKSLIR